MVAVSNWELFRQSHGTERMEDYVKHLAKLVKNGTVDALPERKKEGSSVLPERKKEISGIFLKQETCFIAEGADRKTGNETAITVNAKENISGILKPDILILREKNLSEPEYVKLFTNLWEACWNNEAYGANCESNDKDSENSCLEMQGRKEQTLIIPHTFLTAAYRTGSIHLPLPLLKTYREEGKLSDMRVIGASVHSPEEAKLAKELGADYVTAGHIFATDCKKGVPPRGMEFLEKVCDSVTIPVYAIGGIHQENLDLIRSTKAAGACMMSEYMN